MSDCRLRLADFYVNKTLRKKLPIFNFKDNIGASKSDSNASLRMMADQIVNFTREAARPYYKGVKVTRKNRTIVVSGNLKTTYNKAYSGIVKSIEGKRRLIACLTMNNDLFQSALIEDANRRTSKPVLNIRANSISEINNMNANQLFGMLNDIMNDVLYSGNYPQTAKRYKIK